MATSAPPPTPASDPDRLQHLHPVPVFDDHVRFDEPAHVYYIDGVAYQQSATGFIKSFFPAFDADRVIAKMMRSRNWTPANQYYGKTPAQIKAQWRAAGTSASQRGTDGHARIEAYYNRTPPPGYTDERGDDPHALVATDAVLDAWAAAAARDGDAAFAGFARYEREHVRDAMVPWRTELRAFDAATQLAGSVDMLYRPRPGTAAAADPRTLYLYDWKFSKEIKRANRFESGRAPLAHLPNCNHSHYALQLNLYKRFIEAHTEYRVARMCLVRFHDTLADRYELIEVADMRAEIDAMLDARRRALAAATVAPTPAPAPARTPAPATLTALDAASQQAATLTALDAASQVAEAGGAQRPSQAAQSAATGTTSQRRRQHDHIIALLRDTSRAAETLAATAARTADALERDG